MHLAVWATLFESGKWPELSMYITGWYAEFHRLRMSMLKIFEKHTPRPKSWDRPWSHNEILEPQASVPAWVELSGGAWQVLLKAQLNIEIISMTPAKAPDRTSSPYSANPKRSAKKIAHTRPTDEATTSHIPSFNKKSAKGPQILQVAWLQYLLVRKMHSSTIVGATSNHTTKPMTVHSSAAFQYSTRRCEATRSMNPHSTGAETCNTQPLVNTFWRSSVATISETSERTSSSKATVLLPNQIATHCLTTSLSHVNARPAAFTWPSWQQALWTSSKFVDLSFLSNSFSEWK